VPLQVARSPVDALVARATDLSGRGGRRLLGITGAPGAGKSTLAADVTAALGERAVLVPMDGFHLAQARLQALGLAATKGAIDTFDAGGFVHLLARLRATDEPVVHAPEFRREIEEPVAGAIGVPRDIPLVVVEGNYLLVDSAEWRGVRPLLDEVWYVDPGEDQRMAWLVSRHMAFGRSRAEAEERACGSDQVNAELIRTTRDRADVVVVGV
jgi:pantothenate kinase